jgi:putative redox protein
MARNLWHYTPSKYRGCTVEANVAESRLVWLEKERFVGFDGAGHPVVVSSQDAENTVGLKPTDLLLLSLASCSAVDIVRILAKQRQSISGLEIAAQGEQEAQAPWRFTHIHLTYRLRGRGLNEEGRKAVDLAEGKYCSVAASLQPQVTLTHAVELSEDPS